MSFIRKNKDTKVYFPTQFFGVLGKKYYGMKGFVHDC